MATSRDSLSLLEDLSAPFSPITPEEVRAAWGARGEQAANFAIAQQATQDRSAGELVQDTGAGIVGTLAQIGGLFDLAQGGIRGLVQSGPEFFDDTALAAALERQNTRAQVTQEWRSEPSQAFDYLRAQAVQQAREQAYQQGSGDIGAEAAAALEVVNQYARNPGQIVTSALAQTPYLLGGGAARAVTSLTGIGRLVASTFGKEAAERAILGLGYGAVEGSDAAASTYQQAIAEGKSTEDALAAAGEAFAIAGGISAVSSAAVSRFDFNLGKAAGATAAQRLRSNVQDLVGESVQEFLESGGSQFAGNVALGREYLAGVGEQGAEGAVIAAGMTGGIRAPSITKNGILAVANELASRAGLNAEDARQQATRQAASNINQQTANTAAAPETKAAVQAVADVAPGNTITSPIEQVQAAETAIETVQSDASLDQQTKETLVTQLTEYADSVQDAVETAVNNVAKISDETIERLAASEAPEAQRTVQAIASVDMTRVPEASLPEEARPLAQELKTASAEAVESLEDVGQQVITTGFRGLNYRLPGIKGHAQALFAAVNSRNPAVQQIADRMVAYVANRQEQAALVRQAKESGEQVTLPGKTRKGTNRWYNPNNANSRALGEKILAEAEYAQRVLDRAKRAYPTLFAETAQEVPQASQTQAATTVAPEPFVLQETAPVAAEGLVTEELSEEDFQYETELGRPLEVDKTLTEGLPEGHVIVISNEAGGTKKATYFVGDQPVAFSSYADTPETTVNSYTTPEYRRSGFKRALDKAIQGEGHTLVDGAASEVGALAQQARNQPEFQESAAAVDEISAEDLVDAVDVTTPAPTEALPSRGVPVERIGFEKAFGQPANRPFASRTLPEFVQSLGNSSLGRYLSEFLGGDAGKHIRSVLNNMAAERIKQRGWLDVIRNRTPDPLWGYTDNVWVHVLDTDGRIPQEVMDAMLFAGAMALPTINDLPPVDMDAYDQYAEENQGITLQEYEGHLRYLGLVREISKNIQQILRLSPNPEITTSLTVGLPVSLATSVIAAMDQAGMIVRTKGSPVQVHGVDSFQTRTGIRSLSDFDFTALPEVQEILNLKERVSVRFDGAETNVPNRVDGTTIPLSNEQKTALRNRNKVEHRINPLMQNFLGRLNKETIGKLLGVIDLSKVTKAFASVARSRNIELTSQLDLAETWLGQMQEDSTLNFTYSLSVNGRSNGGNSPQGKKWLREVFTNGRVVLDMTNPANRSIFKKAVVQAMDTFKVDTKPDADIEAHFDENQVEWTRLGNVLANGTEQEILAAFDGQVLAPRTINALLHMAQYDETNQTADVSLVFESDGKTNGPFMAELLFGMHDPNVLSDQQTLRNLQAGGLFLGSTTASLKTEAVPDLYTRLLNYLTNTEQPSGELLTLLRLADYYKEYQAQRALGKDATTPVSYGSSAKGISNQITTRLVEALYTALNDVYQTEDRIVPADLVAVVSMLDPASGKAMASKDASVRSKALEDFYLSQDEKSILQGEVLEKLAEPLALGYAKEKPDASRAIKHLIAVSSALSQVSQVLYDRMYKKAQRQLVQEGKLAANQALPQTAINAIMKRLPKIRMPMLNGGSLDASESMRGYNPVHGKTTIKVSDISGASPLALENLGPTDIGVRAAPLFVQGLGDGLMQDRLFQTQRNTLDVYDGVDIPLDQVESTTQELNQIVLEIGSYDAITPILKMAQALSNKADLVQEFINDDANLPLKMSLLEAAGSGNFRNQTNTQKILNTLVSNLEDMQRNHAKAWETIHASPLSMNQMTGGNTFVQQGGEVRKQEIVGKAGGSATTAAILDTVRSRESLIRALDAFGFTGVQKIVWNRLRHVLPANLEFRFTPTKQQWEATQMELWGEIRADYHDTYGVYSDGVIIANVANMTTILHELVHAAFTDALYSNSPQMRQITRMLGNYALAFTKMRTTDSHVRAVQRTIQNLLAEDHGEAIDEFMTYALTDPQVSDFLETKVLGQESFLSRLKNLIVRTVRSFLGLPVSTQTFMEGVLETFHRIEPIHGDTVNQVRYQTNVQSMELLDSLRDVVNTWKAKWPGQRNKQFHDLIKNSPVIALEKAGFAFTPDNRRLFTMLNAVLGFAKVQSTAEWRAMDHFVRQVIQNLPTTAFTPDKFQAIFSGKNTTQRVVSLYLTHPEFKAEVDRVVLDSSTARTKQTLKSTVQRMFNPLLAGATAPDMQALLAAETQSREYEAGLLALGDKAVSGYLDRFGNRMQQLSDDTKESQPIVSTMTLALSGLTSDRGAEAFVDTFNTMMNNANLWSWVRELGASLVGATERNSDILALASKIKTNIGTTRQLFRKNMAASLQGLFSKDSDAKLQSDLFDGLGKLGVEVLHGMDLSKVYGDTAFRKDEIRKLLNQLPQRYRDFYQTSSESLGKYLATRVSTDGFLLKNADAIAHGVGQGISIQPTQEHIQAIDKLISLYAVENLPMSLRIRMASHALFQPEAIDKMMILLQNAHAKDKARDKNSIHRFNTWKGALPQNFDARRSLVLASDIRGAELKALGYEVVGDYRGHPADRSKLKYYARTQVPPAGFSEGVFATVKDTVGGINFATGTSLTPEVGTLIRNPYLVRGIHAAITRGDNTPGLVPVFDKDGNVVAFERLLDPALLEKHLAPKNELHSAVAALYGRIAEEHMAHNFNRLSVKALSDMWNREKKEGMQEEYVDIATTSDPIVAAAWRDMPAYLREDLKAAFDGPVMIRKDLVHNAVGYFQPTVMDLFSGQSRLPKELRDTVVGAAQVFMGASAPKVLSIGEQILTGTVASVRDMIIVRSFVVGMSNVLSNLWQVVANGVNPKTLYKEQSRLWAEMRTYVKLRDLQNEATTKHDMTQDPLEKQRQETLQRSIREHMRRLSIWPLIEAGEFSSVVEETLPTQPDTLMGDFSGWLRSSLRNVSPKLETAAAYVVVAKDTKLYQGLSAFVQYGDFLGKAMVYQAKVNQGVDPKKALEYIREEFVDYSLNMGRTREALEKYGLLWFSQYKLQIQHIILRRLRHNPVSMLVAAATSNTLSMPNILDGVLWNTNIDMATGMDNIVEAGDMNVWLKLFPN